MLDGATGKRSQLRSRSCLYPWKSPQSTRTRFDPVSSRYRDPVTVPVAPRNCSVCTLVSVADAVGHPEVATAVVQQLAIRRMVHRFHTGDLLQQLRIVPCHVL